MSEFPAPYAIAGRYALLRFNPDPVRGEVINVGVLLEEPDGIIGAFASERRPAWFDAAAFDPRVYQSLIEDIREKADAGMPLERFVREYSGMYEFTEPYMLLIDNPVQQLAKLAKRFLQDRVSDQPTYEELEAAVHAYADAYTARHAHYQGAPTGIPSSFDQSWVQEGRVATASAALCRLAARLPRAAAPDVGEVGG